MSKALRSSHERQSGSMMVLMALMSMLLIAFVGLVVDGGELTAQSRLSQSAADGAALAAAYDITNNGYSLAEATALGQAVATKDGIPSGDITFTYLDSSGAVTATPASVATVKANVTHNFPFLFLPIINLDQASIGVSASATTGSGAGGCAICALNSINYSGNGGITVTGGSIQVGGNLTANGNGSITATSVGVVGTCSCTTTINPAPAHVSSVADPYASITLPTSTTPNRGNVNFSGNGGLTVQPGVYGNLNFSGNGGLTFAAGTYIFTGSGINYSGNGGFNAGAGVMLYFACSQYPTPCNTGQAGATFNASGNGGVTIAGLTTTPYKGMALMYDPKNTSAINLSMNGGGSFTGSLYGASSTLNYSGNGGIASLNSRIVVKSLPYSGNGGISVSYTASQNYSTGGHLQLLT